MKEISVDSLQRLDETGSTPMAPTPMRSGFSVLMSVYAAERPEFLSESLQSIADSDDLPAEVVLVEDGPIGEPLLDVVDSFRSKLPIRSLRLERNAGLPAALNIGLQHAQHEFVARFDTDDVCAPTRFGRQMLFLEEHPQVAAVGGWVEEFDTHSRSTLSLRSPPILHEQLVRYARLRSPLNHPAVMFRKSAVLAVGSYQSDKYFEDYSLWVRLILAGHQIANIPHVLVRMRAGRSQVERRRGLTYVRHELAFVRKLCRLGFLSQLEALRYVLLRTPFRLMPGGVLNFVYQRRLRDRPGLTPNSSA
jgi:glycosyltransferase involved in cell wall biosynthesis